MLVGESKWGYAPDVDESDFRCTILACLSSAIETAGNIVKFCNSPSTNFRIQDEIVSKIALTLVRGTSFPQLEAAGPCVVAMPSMIQKDSGQMQGKINALLSNCLLKRMSDPNCYSGTIDFTKLEAKGTTTVKKKNKTAAKNEQNLMQSTLLLSDSCINSFIDMHSSDSEEYLSYFTKLRALEILSEVSTRFKQRVQVAFASLEEIDESRFYETIENLDSFISYKSDYLRAH